MKSSTLTESLTVALPAVSRNSDAPVGSIKLSLSDAKVTEAELVVNSEVDRTPPKIPLNTSASRPDLTDLGPVLAVEQLLDLEVPELEQWLRTLYCELLRLQKHSHLLTLGFANLGFRAAVTDLFMCHRLVDDLFEVFPRAVTGESFFQPGGSRETPGTEFYQRAATLLERLPARLAEVEEDFFEHPVFLARSRGVGEVEIETALDWNITGPAVRATGVDWDIRRTEPYCKYESVNFQLPVGNAGDLYDRYLVLLKEMQQSLKIIEQSLEQFAESETVDNVPGFMRAADCSSRGRERVYKFSGMVSQLPEAEISLVLEASCGEQCWDVEADGENNLICRLQRQPGIYNLQLLLNLLPGCSASEARATINSLETV